MTGKPLLSGGHSNNPLDENLVVGYGLDSFGGYSEGVQPVRANGGDCGGGSETLLVSSIDVRNFGDNGDVSGTLQAKKSGGYSLNYTNPIAFAWQQGATEQGRERIVRAGDYAGSVSGSRVDAVAWVAECCPTLGKESNSPRKSSSGQMVDFSIVQNGVRRLTPVECERLQGFIDNWTDGFPDSIRYKMLGNAVNRAVTEWIGRRIVAVENQ